MVDIRKVALSPIGGFRHVKETIAEWGNAEVIICEPSEAAISEFNRRKSEDMSKEESDRLYIAVIVIDVVRHLDGSRVFKSDDVETLKNAIGPVYIRIVNKATKLSGWLNSENGDNPIEGAVKK